jgi:hypothetical protein
LPEKKERSACMERAPPLRHAAVSFLMYHNLKGWPCRARQLTDFRSICGTTQGYFVLSARRQFPMAPWEVKGERKDHLHLQY